MDQYGIFQEGQEIQYGYIVDFLGRAGRGVGEDVSEKTDEVQALNGAC